ncbi:MAG TPA: sigma-E factor negative regulatory protein [Pusillimonas sp.]|uniref:sigma-E factor negative regulatory protein n=1 Tax=Pusillimonas sp. TaxID=3040095 RepID=UPI002C1CEC27|nr:sigma-E factor negative regulatory protein [Pusillimonas sp.]HUH88713.1 sigma-E factor negative regulatory protein [Pusillimonas sp.]
MQGVNLDAQTESWDSTVSAWMDGDGEIRPEDLDSPYGRQVWDTYHLIGDVLRSEELALKPSDLFYARLSKAIDAEPPIVATPRVGFSAARLGLSGVAVAAAIASVVWVALPYFSGQASEGSQVQVLAAADDDQVVDYIEAHRQFAGANPIRQVSFGTGASR